MANINVYNPKNNKFGIVEVPDGSTREDFEKILKSDGLILGDELEEINRLAPFVTIHPDNKITISGYDGIKDRTFDVPEGATIAEAEILRQINEAEKKILEWAHERGIRLTPSILTGIKSLQMDDNAIRENQFGAYVYSEVIEQHNGKETKSKDPTLARYYEKVRRAKRGITIRTADAQAFAEADMHFGWVDSACNDVTQLRNFGKNWYSFERPHPKIELLQKRFLFESDIWKSLKRKLNSVSFTLFVIKILSRWKAHNKQLANYRQREEEKDAAQWKAITKDMSMFTSGYSCAREVLGPETAFELYRRMFLDIGKMEMRWLWPKPETFAALPNPEQAIKQYWCEFMTNYQALGLFDLTMDEADSNQLKCKIENCAYAKMFSELGCPELSNLVSEMEREALEYIAGHSKLNVTWLTGDHGAAEISLRQSTHSEERINQSTVSCA